MNERMNWPLLLETVAHFESLGFTYVEVPWLVSIDAIRATFKGNNNPVFQRKYVVGSGEQSFIQMQLQGDLKPGKYVTLTPCFRDEEKETPLKKFSFMKAELYVTDNTSNEAYIELVNQCKDWFTEISGYVNPAIEVVQTPEGHDINLNKIEIGSYGFRWHEGVQWIYGTALAEPRFTTVDRFYRHQ